MKSFECKDFFFALEAEEAISSLEEGALAWMGQFDDLVEEFSEEGVAILVLACGHGDGFIVV
jgi:hypothetical protein